MDRINVAPFALPNCAPGEVRFEEPRDIERVVVNFRGAVPKGTSGSPAGIGVSYLRKNWPGIRLEERKDVTQPAQFGWVSMDDQFNGAWQKAAVVVRPGGARRRDGARKVDITFEGLSREGLTPPEDNAGWSEKQLRAGYDVRFRRTMGIRVDCDDPGSIEEIEVYTKSPVRRSVLHVQLDKGARTPGNALRMEGYNALIEGAGAGSGDVGSSGTGGVNGAAGSAGSGALELSIADQRDFSVAVRHMQPWFKYARDDGHIRFILEEDSFTVSLTSLEKDGPIWFEEYGVYITSADDETGFESYRAACSSAKTISRKVMEHPEQSYAGAVNGQPRAHPVAYTLGCKHERQRFWQDPNGDILLTRKNVHLVTGRDTEWFTNSGTGRLFFGLEGWSVLGRFTDPAPILAYNLRFRKGSIELEHKSFAVLLEAGARPKGDGRKGVDPKGAGPKGDTPRGDDPVICLVRLRFSNRGDAPARAALTLTYSQDSARSQNRYFPGGVEWSPEKPAADDWLVPQSEREPLALEGCVAFGRWKGKPAFRLRIDTEMSLEREDGGIRLFRDLEPGDGCEAVLKIPFISLDAAAELKALERMDFDESYRRLSAFWREEASKGARLTTPVEQINSLHLMHPVHVQVTDIAMPDEPALINTSVGSSSYGNFSNESCMIVRELMERGLFEDVRRRLDVWVKYQGTVPLPGNFTDHEGLFYGAGGFEMGEYNQHHGWVLWAICEYFLFTGDREWFERNVDAAIAGADWVFRQRKNTMGTLPHSRGWERGFLPAGSLEDVKDFHYWLSTNALTWRGCESCARALEEMGHPDAGRVRKEADAFRRDLIRGFDTMRRHSPLVRLRNGRWIPQYPSRIYCRGRDLGWIRALLEGSVYLLLSGLYSSTGREADWILEDYQDNLYMCPPYGYAVVDEESEWFDRGGFSIQPNLLAGLLPYLERDEPELYIWMFFNAWAACYREEIGAMVEHPLPVLGYSNWAHFKTSDQANAMMWLRCMFVYAKRDALYLGRAIPRAWFRHDAPIRAVDVETPFGRVGVTYRTDAGAHEIAAEVDLQLRRTPARISVRFRHPEKRKIASVEIDGRQCLDFDPVKGDVDVTGREGRFSVTAAFEARGG